MGSIFPKGFLWGASTSSYQIEGENVNNWSEWEKKTAEERVRNVPTWYEFPKGLLNEATDISKRLSGEACDSFRMWKEDIGVLNELGMNSYRFSVEWSRIFPKKGEVSEYGLEYYRKLIKELKGNGIEPVLTCWHWTLPLWLEEEGGLMSKSIVVYFREYFKILAENFGNDVKYWITLNEPDVISYNSYLSGVWPPCKRNIFKTLYLYYFRMVNLHKVGYYEIKKINPEAMIGVSKNNSFVEPYDRRLINVFISKVYHFFENILYLRFVSNSLDFIGINFYFHNKIGVRGIRNDNDRVSDMGWWMKPGSLYNVLMDLKCFNLPVMITENGVADYLDQYREWWLDESFNAMENALKSGVNLIGYMHWSLLDNFEWTDGFWPKFGLASIDPVSMKRKVRKSGYFYKDLIGRNS